MNPAKLYLVILLVVCAQLSAADYNSCIDKGNRAIASRDLTAALSWYQQAYELNPDSKLAEAINGLEYNIAAERGQKADRSADYAAALDSFLRAWSLKQVDGNLKLRIVQLYEILGRRAYNAGDFPGAKALYSTAADFTPQRWQAWRGVAASLYRQASYQACLVPLSRAIGLAPDNVGLTTMRNLVAWRRSGNGGVIGFAEYQALNAAEERLAAYRDSDETLWLKLSQLAYLNESRRRHGASEVRLDILASRVANRMCREACENRYVGHWNLRGEKPYHRWAFAGGRDHVAENGSMREIIAAPGEPADSAGFLASPDSYAGLMSFLHDGFMAERAPHDGHKQNCIGRFHTRVGLGAYLYQNQFRYYEEFIDRHLEFIQAPSRAKPGETLRFSLKPIDPAKHLFMVLVYWEAMPRQLTAAQANRKGAGPMRGYDDFTAEVVLSLSPWQLKKAEGVYTFPVEFKKAGLYYIKAYLSDRAYRPDERGSTEGKAEASGIVVKVRP